jgi:hypothetical protein
MICNVSVTFETVNVLAQLFTTWVVEQYCWTRKSRWPAAIAVQRLQLKVDTASSATHARNRCTILPRLGHCIRVRKSEGGLGLETCCCHERDLTFSAGPSFPCSLRYMALLML